MKRCLVLGAGGFIGGHLVESLKNKGHWVRGVDIKLNEFRESSADNFIQGDLRDPTLVDQVITEDIDEVYQLAADMGGALLFSLVKMTLILCIIPLLLI